MSIWNFIFGDKPDDDHEGNPDSIRIGLKTPTGYEGKGGRGGCSIPKNMAGCLFYLFLFGLGCWALTDYSNSLDEPRQVRVCASASIWPWDSCR